MIFNRSLRYMATLLMLLFFGSASVVLVVLTYRFTHEAMGSVLHDSVESQAELFLLSGREALIAQDFSLLEELVDAGLRLDTLYSIYVVRNGVEIIKKDKSVGGNIPSTDSLLKIRKYVTVGGKNFGFIEFKFFRDRIEDTIWGILYTMISVLIVSILLALLFSYSLVHYICRQLERIGEATVSIREGAYCNPVADEDEIARSHEEIARLLKSFENMRINILQSYQEVDKSRAREERASAVKSEFLANISHELRTPLNGILGFLDILAKSDLTGEQYDYVKTSEASAQQMLRLVNDILDYTQVDSVWSHRTELFDITAWFESVERSIEATSESENREFVAQIVGEVPQYIISYRVVLERIIEILASNAIKFNPEGGGVILLLECLKTESEKAMLRFSVSDSGVGISDEFKDELFTPFSQEDSATSRTYDGAGIGLALAKSMGEVIGGDFSVDTRKGVGTSFRFTLEVEVLPDIEHELFTDSFKPESFQDSTILVLSSTPEVSDGKKVSDIVEKLLSVGFNVVRSSYEPDTSDICQESYVAALLVDFEPLNSAVLLKQLAEFKIPVLVIDESSSVTGLGKQLLSHLPQDKSDPATVLKRVLKLLKERRSRRSCVSSEREKLKILLVEDNPINQKLAQVLLKKAGHETSVAENGKAALETLDSEEFDCILMDIQMPIMDGLEATRRIRESKSSYSRIPILAVSANISEGISQRCLEVGMDGYLSKPIVAKRLLLAIKDIL